MQNKNTTIIIVLLVIIAGILAVIALKKLKNEVIEIPVENTPVVQAPTQPTTTSQAQWKTSSTFGFKYPTDVNVYESKNPPYAEMRFTYDGAVISWGGANSECMEYDDYGVFVPGVSTVVCLNGNQARIGLENPRNTISQKALDMFGEFVLNNNKR